MKQILTFEIDDDDDPNTFSNILTAKLLSQKYFEILSEVAEITSRESHKNEVGIEEKQEIIKRVYALVGEFV